MNDDRMTVLVPIERNDKTFWLKVGNAYRNKDGSINVYLDALPLGGKLQLRTPTERQNV